MPLITVLIFLVQIFSLLIFRPLTKILIYFMEGNFFQIILLISFAFLITGNSNKHE